MADQTSSIIHIQIEYDVCYDFMRKMRVHTNLRMQDSRGNLSRLIRACDRAEEEYLNRVARLSNPRISGLEQAVLTFLNRFLLRRSRDLNDQLKDAVARALPRACRRQELYIERSDADMTWERLENYQMQDVLKRITPENKLTAWVFPAGAEWLDGMEKLRDVA